MDSAIKDLFKKHFKASVDSIAPVQAHGSERKLFRLTGGGRTVIGASNPDLKENKAFLEFSRHFRKCGLPVPEIYAEDLEDGAYLEEDLGDMTLFRYLSENRSKNVLCAEVLDAYGRALRLLPQFQVTAGKTLDYRFCYPRASFDKQSMMWDLNYFKYYFLRLGKIAFNEQALEEDFNRFSDFLLKAPRDYFLYRDFQSRNIMIQNGSPRFIDYQGGRKGALQYDVASLLFDAKADLPEDARERLLSVYLDAAGEQVRMSRRKFMEHYHAYAYIRIMQAMGAYGLRGFYEGKTLFLQSIPYAIRNLEHLLSQAELPIAVPELMRVFKRMVASSALRQFGDVDLELTVRVQSFSYASGIPADDRGHGGGFVFDCRALPNPGKHSRFRESTGKDSDVIAFMDREPAVREFLSHALDLVDQAVENYRGRNFTALMVSFGCTGGQHRSVYCAERLARHLQDKLHVRVELRHRDLERALSAT